MTPEEYLNGGSDCEEHNNDVDALLAQEIADYEADEEALLELYYERVTLSRKAQFVLDLNPNQQDYILLKVSEQERNAILYKICRALSFNNFNGFLNQQDGQLPKKLAN
jgi:hypothetical protein